MSARSGRPALPALTGLRFLAALGVMGYHGYCAPCTPALPTGLGRLVGAGFSTVSLFFILSGFILAYTYLDEGGMRGTRTEFFRARFARLYPVYLVSLLVDLPMFVRAIHQAEPAASAGEVLRITGATLTLTQGWLTLHRPTWNIVAWTLSVEAFFYVLFPFVGPWLARRRSRWLGVIALGAWALGTTPMLAADAAARLREGPLAVMLHAWGRIASEAIPLARLPEFLIGLCVGLVFCRREHPAEHAWARTGGFVLVTGALTVGLMVLPGPPSPLVQAAVLVPLFTASILLLAGGLAGRGLGLGTRGMVLLGGASYALYMTHGSLLNYALAVNTRTFTLPHNVLTLLMVPVAVGVSVLLFQRVEEPMRHRLRSPAQRRDRSDAASTQGGNPSR
ncbi:acyltransferase family protein [Corallococcus carmarthensis]|uniref:acyltransferase family protein n=1 Tax=Corallococcus carmarthensis TaxID=2316728 RepID=UPI00148D4D9D|nr:acyltransferase [Corallococcus carmarthensis]NOK20576.1 acyltransferase [Corallococcus carmarthensis]